MPNSADTSYISQYIDEIINLVGIKTQIDEGVIFHEFRLGNIKTCIEYIANHLNLPIVVNVSYISADSFATENGNGFISRDQEGAGKWGNERENTAAQVSIPSKLPLYGSPEFKGLSFDVKVNNNCLKYPETFIGIMAHELSHVVLHSLWHKEKHNELFTDLTAMSLGFADIIKKGRKNYRVRQNNRVTETTTSTYGYLSDSQFDFAYAKIVHILTQYLAMEDSYKSELQGCRLCLQSCQEETSRLIELLQAIDKKQNKRMAHRDAISIVRMHEPGYFEKTYWAINEAKKQLHGIESALGNFQSYNPAFSNTMRDCMNHIKSLSVESGKIQNLIQDDIRVLEKYQGILWKINKGLQKENSAR